MSAIKETKFEKIKEILIARKRELEEAITQLQTEGDVTNQVQDPGDQANSAAFESLKSSLHNNEYEEFKMIDKALVMIEAGTYGMCVDCEQPISEKRLQSYPNATRCIMCQEAAEEEAQKNASSSYF
jgi:DnaK suppressor protein